MIDLASEELATLARAAREFVPPLRRDARVAPSTLWRWARRGSHGIRLEVAKVGGTMVTSREAVMRFIARCTDPGAAPAARTAKLERDNAKARERLAKLGIA